MKKKFAVIGLGQFGTAISKTLSARNAEVIAIDKNIERVRKEYQITNYIGIGIITIFLWQLWIISS